MSSDIVSDALTAAACSCFWIFSAAAVIATTSKYLPMEYPSKYPEMKYPLNDIFPNQLVLFREDGCQKETLVKFKGLVYLNSNATS